MYQTFISIFPGTILLIIYLQLLNNAMVQLNLSFISDLFLQLDVRKLLWFLSVAETRVKLSYKGRGLRLGTRLS